MNELKDTLVGCGGKTHVIVLKVMKVTCRGKQCELQVK